MKALRCARAVHPKDAYSRIPRAHSYNGVTALEEGTNRVNSIGAAY